MISIPIQHKNCPAANAVALIIALSLFTIYGCGQDQKQNKDFYTSGNPEADQRADQRMAQSEQLLPGCLRSGRSAHTDALVRRQEADHPICLSRDFTAKHANRVSELLRVEIEARSRTTVSCPSRTAWCSGVE